MEKRKCIGILLSGGVAAVMDYCVRYIVEEFTKLDYEVIGFLNGWKGLMDGNYIVLTPQEIKKANYKDYNQIITSCTKINVFDYKGGNYAPECKQNFDKLDLEFIFAIGGDGTVRQASDLIDYGLNFVHIPATMDRDLTGSDMATGGFYTAVDEASKAIIAMAKDSYKMCRTAVIEIMGRKSGAVAMYASAKAMEQVNIDFVLIPDKKYSINKIAKKIRQSNRPLVIVLAEGINDVTKKSADSKVGVHVSLAGISYDIANDLNKKTQTPVKALQCDYRLRSAPPVKQDIELVENFINMAIEKLKTGHINFSTIKNADYDILPIKQMKMLNPSSDEPKLLLKEDPIWKVLSDMDFGEE